MKPEKQFASLFSNSPISLDQTQKDNLIQFLLLLKQWSKKMNLISYADRKEVYMKHFIPSFWFSDVVKQNNADSLLDIGTGAGFPGTIMKILNPKMAVCLIESNRKKTLFLKEVADQLDINPIIINDRIEKFKLQSEKTFDVIVSRAVTSVKQIWEWSNGLLNDDGAVFVLKGTDYKDETDLKASNNFKIEEFKPELKWSESSSDLTNKLILKMRKQ